MDLNKNTYAVICDEFVDLKEFIEAHKHVKRQKAKPAPKIEQLLKITSKIDLQEIENIDIVGLQEIRKEYEQVTDNRNLSYVDHSLADILVIVLLAVLANCDSWFAIETFGKAHEKWLRQFLVLKNGVPTDDTYRLVLSKVDVNYVYEIMIGLLLKKIDEAIQNYGQPITEEPDVIALDGKVSKSSSRSKTAENEAVKPLNTLNAYSSNLGLCLGQEFIERKSNEIPAAPVLTGKIDIEGAIVTCDALNTQTKTAEAIVAGGGKYVMPVKGNHPKLQEEISKYFTSPRRWKIRERPEQGQSYIRTEEKEHDNIVIREYFLSTDTEYLRTHGEEWPNLTSIGFVRKTVVNMDYIQNKVQEESRCYICGGVTEAEDFSRSVRLHWGVENGLHWQLDYTFKDDSNKTMAGSGAEGLQIFKKIGIALLKTAKILWPAYRSLNDIRTILCHDFEINIGKIFTVLTLENILKANTKTNNDANKTS